MLCVDYERPRPPLLRRNISTISHFEPFLKRGRAAFFLGGEHDSRQAILGDPWPYCDFLTLADQSSFMFWRDFGCAINKRMSPAAAVICEAPNARRLKLEPITFCAR